MVIRNNINMKTTILIKKIINRFLKLFQVSRIPTNDKVVYLTFDDGPEPGINEFVLDELRKYGFKGTFFCRGDNANHYPELLSRIINEGHSIGNHTYSHLHAYSTSSKHYLDDVERANKVLHSTLLRPPFGSLTLTSWLSLKSKYRIIYWSLGSGDSNLDNFDLEHSCQNLINKSSSGDIVLFHFCKLHENETRKLLPAYCKWLKDNNYISKSLDSN